VYKASLHSNIAASESAGELAATATYTRDPTSHIFHSLGNITNPVLVMGGTLDIRISIADLYTLVDYIPNASLVLRDSAGHESVQQYAITAGGIISDFLDEQSTTE
jgi:homoserine acetyltransferase